MSTASKRKVKPPTSNSNSSGGGRSGIPTLRSLRTLFAPTSVQTRPASPSSPSLNLPTASRRKSLNLLHGSAQAGNDISASSLDNLRRSMTLGRRTGSRSVSRDSREEVRLGDQKEMKAMVMDIRPDSPLDLSTIVEADTSGLSLAESLSKHLPALPTESESRSVSFSPSPSPSPSPYPNSASASSLNLPRSPSSINAQVHSALQVDPALAALLSPNNLSFSPTLMSAPPSPRSPPSRVQTSLHPQHASTPYSSVRVKNPNHLGLARPPYIRDPSSDESRSSMSISRPLSSASATRPGSSLSASALARTSHTPTHTRTRSMSVDEHPRSISKAGSLTARNFSELPRRHHYTTHNRSLSHFGTSQNDVADATQSSRNLQRPPITEWLGPRTAKAFKAAGLLGSNDHLRSPSTHSYFDSIQSASPASAPSSPSRPRFRPTSSYTPDSPNSPTSPILSPHPRSASVAASAISGISARSGGSVRSASTAATSLSVSASAQATREYLMQSHNQAQPQKLSQFQPTLISSSSTLNLPTLFSPVPSVSGHTSTSISELQQLKDQHSAETSALLGALSDAQQTARILRAENDELRESLALSKAKQNNPEREHLETRLAEMQRLMGEVKGKRGEEVKELNSRLQQAESRAMGAESRLSEFKNINLKLRQALHASQREKACVEAEAETRAEEALRRIEQLEDALAEASRATGNTIAMARTYTEPNVEETSEFHTDSQSGVRVRPRLWTNESTPSSASSSRPPSIFPLPPENMSLLMYESVDGVEQSASEFDISSLENIHVEDSINVDSILDARETQWRQSMHMSNDSTYPSDRSRTIPHGQFHSSMYDHGHGQRSNHCSYDHSYEFQEDEGTGNTLFLEGDSIISSEGDPDSPDPDGDPTVHADAADQYRFPDSYSRSQLYASLSASSSPPSTLRVKTTGIIKTAAKDEDDDGTTSFEGTGTPGSPGSLLWMDPAVERHLGDLNDSVENLGLSGG